MRASEVRVAGLVHFVSAERISGVLLDKGRREVFQGPPTADVIPLIDELRGELRETAALSFARVPKLDAFAADWGRSLLPRGCVTGDLDVLVIVPHGPLHGLPFHLVLADDGEPLGAKLGVCYASSMSLFARCVERNRVRQYGGSTFDANGMSGARRSPPVQRVAGGGVDVQGRDPRYGRLSARIAEVCGCDPAQVISEGSFGRSRLKIPITDGAHTDLVCVVAHGYRDRDDHRFSGLLLDRALGIAVREFRLYGTAFNARDLPLRDIPADIAAEDDVEVLTAAELEIDVRVEADLVALLGCSAGWAHLLAGDEPASIAETFLRIGCASVVAPLWDAHYDATAAWADAFFEGWAQRGLPKALAARHAQRTLHGAGLGPERAGAIALMGDWL